MSAPRTPPVEPAASNLPEPSRLALAGRSPARRAKRLLLATRPKFFTASVLPVLLGTAWGAKLAGALDALSFALALLATICLHAGANVLNDVGDELNGTDRLNQERIYPYTGGSRFIQNRIMSLQQMTRWALVLLAVASLAGVALVLLEGPAILVFGLTGLVIGAAYSLPPLQLSGRGVGESAVAVAFGILPVSGAAWLQSGVLDADVILLSLPVALWVAAILLVNEVPDIPADAAVGKRTLPVRFGGTGSRRLYLAMQAVALACILAAVGRGLLHAGALALPVVLLAAATYAGRAIRPDRRADMKRAIELTLAIHAAGTVWLLLWIWPFG